MSQLEQIHDEWSSLADTLPDLTPFQTPQWLLTWWKNLGSGEPHVIIFRKDERLVGVIPAFVHDWQSRRQLTLIGSGISDFLEPAIGRADLQESVSCLGNFLADNSTWDVCDWQDLSSSTPLSQLCEDDRFIVELQPDLPCSEIPIDQSFSDFWENRPTSLRRNVRRYRSKAEQTAPIETRVVTSNYKQYLDALIRLHSARWREQGEPGMIAANQSSKFLRDVAQELAASQMLVLFALHFQGDVAAVILAIAYRNVIYGYLSAFDPAYSAFGFGRMLLYEALQYSFEKQYSSWNFLRGTEPYKTDWGARPIPKTRLVISRR